MLVPLQLLVPAHLAVPLAAFNTPWQRVGGCLKDY